VVVVDDASTDHSLAVANNLAVADSRIKVVALPTNQGPGYARNRGVEAAQARYVVFLDADDELKGDFLGAALHLLAEHPQYRAVKCEMEFFDPVKGYILPQFDPRYPAVVLSSACALLVARQDVLDLGGFPEEARYRGEFGGEDVAFMDKVKEHLQPIARLETFYYRVWSQRGSHVDKFLANTRLTSDGSFEFVRTAASA
jgi:glycosyltransferase involved in cell wall biosynthesis